MCVRAVVLVFTFGFRWHCGKFDVSQKCELKKTYQNVCVFVARAYWTSVNKRQSEVSEWVCMRCALFLTNHWHWVMRARRAHRSRYCCVRAVQFYEKHAFSQSNFSNVSTNQTQTKRRLIKWETTKCVCFHLYLGISSLSQSLHVMFVFIFIIDFEPLFHIVLSNFVGWWHRSSTYIYPLHF